MEQMQGEKQAFLYEIDGYKILFARDAYSGEVKVHVGQGDNLLMVDRLPYIIINNEEKRQQFIRDFGKRWIAKYEAGNPAPSAPVNP